MEQTKEEIIKLARLPVSIIIIGLGGCEFEKMKELDADNVKLLGKYSGKLAERDIVQFVPFRKFKNAPGALEDETLSEIPKQFMEFMNEKKIKPKGNRLMLDEASPETRLKSYYDPTKLMTSINKPDKSSSVNPFLENREKLMIQELLQLGFPKAAVYYLIRQGIPCDNKLLAIDIMISKGITLEKNIASIEDVSKEKKSEEKLKKDAFDKGVCLYCREHRAKYAVIGCKHVICCTRCAVDAKGKECPICNKEIIKVVRIYETE